MINSCLWKGSKTNIMPGRTDNLNIFTENENNNNSSSNNNNNMDPIEHGGNAIYTFQAMSGTNPDRYLSNESLETNSSGESNLGNIQHRKDHEFIPTRMKQIAASKPAADPKQFTRVPSNPLLVSAQKQMMMVEEVKKAKELALIPKPKSGDDEPDWQDNLSVWKNRRRKQSEEAFQRVSEAKAMEDEDTTASRKSSIGRKLSSLMYTAPEDDWSDLGLEKAQKPEEAGHKSSRSHSRASLISPTNQQGPIREEDERENDDDDDDEAARQQQHQEQKLEDSTAHEITSHGDQPIDKADNSNVFSSHNNVAVVAKAHSDTKAAPAPATSVDNNATENVKNSSIEIPPPVAVSVLNKKFSEASLAAAAAAPVTSGSIKPLVTFTNQDPSSGPQVRRKSSELSSTMKSRLEAFISPNNNPASPPEMREKSIDIGPEPDEKFHEKLQTFRKISEGQKTEETNVQRKPKLSYSSLIAADFGNSNQRTLPNTNEEEDDDSVDKLLDDALEESYRSVLEDSENKENNLENKKMGDEFLGQPVPMKAPPTEKPPPPPLTPETVKKDVWPQQQQKILSLDDDIDEQEKEIIASLEHEEREHLKYKERVQAMRTAPSQAFQDHSQPANDDIIIKKTSTTQSVEKKISSFASTTTTSTSAVSLSRVEASKLSSSVSQPALGSKPATAPQTAVPIQKDVPKKRSTDVGQKTYNNQHWLIQEAEQRRIAESRSGKSTASPAASSPASSLSSQPSPSPVYENVSGKQSARPASTATNHRPDLEPSNWRPQPPPQQQPLPPKNNIYPAENLYANLGSVPAPQSSFENNSHHYPRDQGQAHGRLPGPQVPPRAQDRVSGQSQNGAPGNERMLSVSGKKKCSHCKEELGRGAAMIIESLRLFYHLRCFQCCVCHVQLGNGTAGTDVRVRNNKLHCQNCYSNDEGLKFSKV